MKMVKIFAEQKFIWTESKTVKPTTANQLLRNQVNHSHCWTSNLNLDPNNFKKFWWKFLNIVAVDFATS